MNSFEFIIEDSVDCTRIDKFLSVKLKDFTRSQIQQLCENQQISVNRKKVAKNYKLSLNDMVLVEIQEVIKETLLPENLPITVLYEDEYLLVVDKPKGMLTHPTPQEKTGTLANRVLYHYQGNLSDIAGTERPGIVHRIDKDTSGLLLVAKDNETHQLLNEKMVNHEIVRKYQAVVHNHFNEPTGILDMPIGRAPNQRVKMAVVADGREAITEYHVICDYPHFTHIDVNLITGRTHQIRVHMAAIGNPVVGDVLYGPKNVVTHLKGQCLHAYCIALEHPRTGEYLEVINPLPVYFTNFLKQIDC